MTDEEQKQLEARLYAAKEARVRLDRLQKMMTALTSSSSKVAAVAFSLPSSQDHDHIRYSDDRWDNFAAICWHHQDRELLKQLSEEALDSFVDILKNHIKNAAAALEKI